MNPKNESSTRRLALPDRRTVFGASIGFFVVLMLAGWEMGIFSCCTDLPEQKTASPGALQVR